MSLSRLWLRGCRSLRPPAAGRSKSWTVAATEKSCRSDSPPLLQPPLDARSTSRETQDQESRVPASSQPTRSSSTISLCLKTFLPTDRQEHRKKPLAANMTSAPGNPRHLNELPDRNSQQQ